jgi:imidazolonepropionase-like amidohydrolase
MRSSFRHAALAALALALTLGSTNAAVGQAPPPYFAITGARIVTGTGATIENGTIIVRDGVIEAVSAGGAVPVGAWELDASGMVAYPGLIDAMSTVGIPAELQAAGAGGGRGGGGRPGAGGGEQAEYSRGPEDRPATFTWLNAADRLEPGDARLASWREAGFTTAVSMPTLGLFPGQAAVINLAGDRPNDMVVATPVALPVTFDKGRQFPGYPNSSMGVIAYVKQLFLDAQYYDAAWSVYSASPSGHERPEYDRALEPMRAAVREDWPVLMPGDLAKEVRRAVRIAREVGLRPIIYGAREAFAPGLAEELASTGVPVLVNLDWPTKDADADPEADEALATLRFRHSAPTSPAVLAEAGATFAFYSGSNNADDAIAGARKAIQAGLDPDDALRAFTLSAAEIFGVDDRIGSIEDGKIANIILTDGDLFTAGTRVTTTIVDGHRFAHDGGAMTADMGDDADADDADDDTAAAAAFVAVPMAPPLGPARTDAVTVIRNATVMTAAEAGTMEGASILVRDGKIAAVGNDIEVPAGAHVIDAMGRYVTPGIIDAHSHIAAESINEGSVSVSSMVGIEDVIAPDDIAIYRGLAGGVTTANVLHGSANPIGGKNAVIKLRWGQDAAGLLLQGAPPGIKFALGENTKRDREPDRYPNSRMGVEDVIRQAFLEAQAYQAEGRRYEQALADGVEGVIPPRRDLKLEALAEIMEGQRLVHAHSYRADEILQLLRTAEEFGFQIATLQHVLEGYRVADEIAEHGAGASTFSDWWAYKVEAYEAIPHNAALMTERGVRVSINSDSGEEMRHLNQEAAKSMKWGGTDRETALAMVTINPAMQLGIDDWVGSIEVGKDADLVLWSNDPMSVFGRVDATMIDGTLWFDREHDAAVQAQRAEEKRQLKELEAADTGGGDGRRRRPTSESTNDQEGSR